MMMTTLKLGKTCFRCFLIIFFKQTQCDALDKISLWHEQELSKLEMTQFFNKSRSDVFALQDQSCTRRQLFMNWVPSFYHILFFMFRMEIDDFVSFIQVSLNTISRHFLVWRFKTFRSFNNPKWNQKFMHWFMREILFLRYSTDKSQLDSTHAFLFSLHSLFMFLLARKLVLDRIFFSFFSANACVVMFIKWISFSFENFFPSFITKFFLFLFQRTLEFNS